MPGNTAIIIIDPYNDFLHPKGKLNAALADTLKEKDTITHLKEFVAAARKNRIPIYYGLHQQCKPGFLMGWKHATPLQVSQKDNVAFEEGSWGVEIYEGLEPELSNGDVVISKHWSSRCGFHLSSTRKVMKTMLIVGQLVPKHGSRLPASTEGHHEPGVGRIDSKYMS